MGPGLGTRGIACMWHQEGIGARKEWKQVCGSTVRRGGQSQQSMNRLTLGVHIGMCPLDLESAHYWAHPLAGLLCLKPGVTVAMKVMQCLIHTF